MFRPAHTPRSQQVDAHPLAYNVRLLKGKAYIYFRLSAAQGKRCGFTRGDPIRIDIDRENRQARILRVDKSSRHLSQGGKNGTSQWAFSVVSPHTGDLETHFPLVPKNHPLTILDTSVSEGLIFELPPLAQ